MEGYYYSGYNIAPCKRMKKEEATETEFDAFKVSCREHSYSSSARNEPCLFDERRDHPIAAAGDDGRLLDRN